MNSISHRIGFMQGRLSPLVDGKIQAFPWHAWQQEFPAANRIGLRLMEWTLDQDRLYENPLMTMQGQAEIIALCKQFDLSLPSLTGDCFMQAPFWKAEGETRTALEADFIAVVRACAAVGIGMVVVPLVDNGRIDSIEQEDSLVTYLKAQSALLSERGIRIVFESDFEPRELARFIDRLDPALFGLNYDIGNSAGCGFNPVEEFAAYASRIVNVHVKDRVLGGTTVPLGTGNADFPTVFSLLRELGYKGNYIMQTARARDDDHAGALKTYMQQIESWVSKAG